MQILVVVATIQVKMLEGLSGEGFHEQVTLPWLSRQLMTQEIPLVGKFFEWGGRPTGTCFTIGVCHTAKGVAIPLPKVVWRASNLGSSKGECFHW